MAITLLHEPSCRYGAVHFLHEPSCRYESSPFPRISVDNHFRIILWGVPRSNAATKERAPKKRSPLRNRRRGRYEKEEKKQRKAAPCGRAKERGERKTLRRHAGNRPPPAGGRRASVVMIADRRKRFHQEQVKIRRKVRKTLQSTCLAQKVSSIRGRFWLLDDVLPGWRQVRRWHCFPQNLRSFRTANHSFFQTVH